MPRNATTQMTKPHQDRNFSPFTKALLAQKQQLAARIAGCLGDVAVDREPEDEGAIAIRCYTNDWAAATLERERRTLREIEGALARLKAGEYGVCDLCSTSIPNPRLEALPWARLCVHCAERSAAA